LRSAIVEQPQAMGFHHKWQLYQRASDALLAHLGLIELGCWDYFDDHDRAERDFQMWLRGMTTREGRDRSRRAAPIRIVVSLGI
jgi:hypothetical protein